MKSTRLSIQNYIQEKVLKNPSSVPLKPLPFPVYKKKIKKNEIITQFGQIEQRAYYLMDGLIESSIDKDGDARIIDFVFPGQFICSYTSFLKETPSEIQTIALTDGEVEYFTKRDLEEAYEHSILANQFGRYVTEQFFLTKLKRENSFLTKNAKQTYEELLLKKPEILKRIPINKIAKYLGIHPESLSRIRAEVMDNH